ncbi:MAG: hypothetical protein ABIV13_03715 [Fimbriimonadales bacterium]
MPNCSICGTPIDKLPNWLDDVAITYRCAVCAEHTAHPPIEHDDEEEEKEAKTQETEEEEEEEEEEETEE